MAATNSRTSKLSFPSARPGALESRGMVWTIQQTLLAEAESRLGTKDPAKKIYQPIFRADGPILVNSLEGDGGFAALSPNAEGYWQTLVYELAHETVHLLDPIPGHTTWIEEGAAVCFSILMSRTLTNHPMKPPPTSAYAEAAALVAQLPTPLFKSLRSVRTAAGKLSNVSADLLQKLFPSVNAKTRARLAEQCIPRKVA